MAVGDATWLTTVAGHRAGVGTVRRIVEHAPDLGIRRMTLYAFSSDNWRRPAQEVQSIFRLMRAYLRLETEKLRKHGVRLQIIGRRDRLPKLLLREIERAESLTAEGECLHLRIAVDYSSREAITRKIRTSLSGFCKRRCRQPVRYKTSSTRRLGRQRRRRSADSHRRREAAFGLSALGVCLCGTFLYGPHVAGLLDTAALDAAVNDFKRRERRFGGIGTNPAYSIAPSAGLSS